MTTKREKRFIIFVALLAAIAVMSVYGCARHTDPTPGTSEAEQTVPATPSTSDAEHTSPATPGTSGAEHTSPVTPGTSGAEHTSPVTPGTSLAETTAALTIGTSLAEATTAVAPETSGAEATAAAPETDPPVTDPPVTEHVHSFTVERIVAPTCTEQGYTESRCSCGTKQLTDVKPATGHSYGGWYTSKPATCAAEGEEARRCERCGAVETKAVAKTEHSFTVTLEPNADPFSDSFGSDGREVCSGCGAENVIAYRDPTYRSDEYLRLLEQRILYWINVFRAEEGVSPAEMLPRMWEYAQVRATYLPDNFAHDVNDERAAATEIKFGRYTIARIKSTTPPTTLKYLDGTDVLVKWQGNAGYARIQVPDPNGETTTSISGLGADFDGKVQIPEGYHEFYDPSCGEAIGYTTVTIRKIDVLARDLAKGCKDSAEHWRYVGIRNYETVGVAISGTRAYAVICCRDEILYED